MTPKGTEHFTSLSTCPPLSKVMRVMTVASAGQAVAEAPQKLGHLPHSSRDLYPDIPSSRFCLLSNRQESSGNASSIRAGSLHSSSVARD